jgi:sec-independent protein translocase protein TatC
MPSQPRPVPPPEDALPRMSLMEHLEELRKRILYSLAAVAVAFTASWAYVDEIFDLLERPIHKYLPEGHKLAIFGVPDAFLLYFKVAGLASLFVAAPFILYQAWCFVAPGLYRHERRWSLVFVLAGSVFFVSGGVFAYLVAVPFAIEFLLGLGQRFEQVIAVDRYLRFEMTLILGLGLMFELPMFIFSLAQMGLVTPRFLMRHFRWAVLIIFFIAAIVTPTPDVVNLCIFALPTIGLYLLGVAAAALVKRRKRQAEAAALTQAGE